MGRNDNQIFCLLFLLFSFMLVTPTLQQCSENVTSTRLNSTSLKDGAPNTITLGVIGTLYSIMMGPAGSVMRFAAERFNNNPNILPDTKIEIVFIPNTRQDLSSNLLLTLYAIQNLKVQGIIGGLSTTESRTIQLAAKLYNVPQISAHAVGAQLSNRDEYPFYACTHPYDSVQVNAFITMFKEFKWRRGIVLYSDNDYGTGFSNLVAKGATEGIDFIGYSIPSATTTTASQIEGQMKQVQDRMKNGRYRVVILYLTAVSSVLVMNVSNELGLVGNAYTYILSSNAAGVYFQDVGKPIRPFLKGSLAVTLPNPQGAFYNEEAAAYNSSSPSLYPPITPGNQFFWVTYDPVMVYAMAFDSLLKQGVPFANIKGQLLYNQILNTSYTGVTGPMQFNPNGDRRGTYSVMNFVDDEQVEVATFRVVDSTLTITKSIVFYDGSTSIPDDGSARAYNRGLAGGLGAIVSVAVLVAFFAIAMLVYHWNAFINKYGIFYCGVILTGVLTSYIAAFSLLPEPTDALCLVFPWFLGIAFTLVYGCLFIKAWILYRLWRHALQLKRMAITALTVVKYVGVALALEAVLLVIWSIVDRPKVHMVVMVDDSVMPQCRSDSSIFWIIFMGMKGVWLLFGVVVSILTRSVVKEYNNFTEFVYAMYNILIMTIIAVPLGILLKEVPNGLTIVCVIVIVLAFMFTTIILFFNIWYTLLYTETMPAISSMHAKSSPSQSKLSGGSGGSSSRA